MLPLKVSSRSPWTKMSNSAYFQLIKGFLSHFLFNKCRRERLVANSRKRTFVWKCNLGDMVTYESNESIHTILPNFLDAYRLQTHKLSTLNLCKPLKFCYYLSEDNSLVAELTILHCQYLTFTELVWLNLRFLNRAIH